MGKPNLDINFLEEAACLLELLIRDEVIEAQDFNYNKSLAQSLRNYHKTFIPSAHNKKNRERSIEELRQYRACFAVLSGDKELEHFTLGQAGDLTKLSSAEKEAVIHELSSNITEDIEGFRQNCARITHEFTRLIEEIWKVPTV